jgi:hypothetical protein
MVALRTMASSHLQLAAVFFILSMLPSCVASQLDPVATGLQSTVAEADSAAAKPDSVDVKLDLMVLKLDLMPMMVDLVAGELESVAKKQACWQRAKVIAAGRKRRGLVLGARRQWAARELELRAGGRQRRRGSWGRRTTTMGLGEYRRNGRERSRTGVAGRHGHIAESSSRYFY